MCLFRVIDTALFDSVQLCSQGYVKGYCGVYTYMYTYFVCTIYHLCTHTHTHTETQLCNVSRAFTLYLRSLSMQRKQQQWETTQREAPACGERGLSVVHDIHDGPRRLLITVHASAH